MASLEKVIKMIANNVNSTTYLKHMMSIVQKSSIYTVTALLDYDKAMRDRAEHLGIDTFSYGDHELVHKFLGLENIKPRPGGQNVNWRKSGWTPEKSWHYSAKGHSPEIKDLVNNNNYRK